jgi:hypothetical protein
MVTKGLFSFPASLLSVLAAASMLCTQAFVMKAAAAVPNMKMETPQYGGIAHAGVLCSNTEVSKVRPAILLLSCQFRYWWGYSYTCLDNIRVLHASSYQNIRE